MLARLLSAVLLLTALTGAPLAQLVPSLTTTGSGEVRIEPDMATIRLGAVSRGLTAREAQDGVNLALTAIVAAVEEAGIERGEIQTSQLALQPVYSNTRRSGETPTIAGYTASYTIAIRITRLELVGPVVDKGLQAGANRLDGLTFGVVDDAPYRREALQAAIRDARMKAEALAEAAHVKILEVLEIAEGGVAIRPLPVVGRGVALAMEGVSVSTPVLPGQVTVSGSVTVRYRVGPG